MVTQDAINTELSYEYDENHHDHHKESDLK